MRQLCVVAAAVVAVGLWVNPAAAGKVEVKGPHICCKQCIKVVGGILGKVEGVTDASCDIQGKTVTFTAKDAKAAEAGVKALLEGGFYGAATHDGQTLKVETPAIKSEKADTLTIQAVHVCCALCQKAISPLFKDAKVTFEGSGAQKDVKIEGKGLDKAAAIETLRKAGFNGK